MKFGLNTVVFLVIITLTIVAWVGFEIYHRQNDLDIPPEITKQTQNPLPDSFDAETLKKLYLGKNNFYEYSTNSSTTEQ
jgi:hypothetical protein